MAGGDGSSSWKETVVGDSTGSAGGSGNVEWCTVGGGAAGCNGDEAWCTALYTGGNAKVEWCNVGSTAVG